VGGKPMDWSQESTATLVAEIDRLQATIDILNKQRLEEPAPIVLKRRQQAGEEVERKMAQFLLQYDPARELKIADVHQIATSARIYAFESFGG
jgi:hypothetical protein